MVQLSRYFEPVPGALRNTWYTLTPFVAGEISCAKAWYNTPARRVIAKAGLGGLYH